MEIKKTRGNQAGFFSRISPEIKAMFKDIVHSLDLKGNETLEVIIRHYYDQAAIKPRPSRQRMTTID